GLVTDEGATYDRTITVDVTKLEPMVTYGTNPGQGVGVTQAVPDPAQIEDANLSAGVKKALAYMDLEAGKPILGKP
ncbi:MAG: 3-isopropylmalate dehydratase large subunit, partial [Desulfuromonadales bacterium]|nr:3-isopropylmalate dehydratase large subunit [Desulfuromonadales bacterium]NIS41315.1 3-isopropylmalate dehydratase large subunit [Desulfuromonadales bacterium]